MCICVYISIIKKQVLSVYAQLPFHFAQSRVPARGMVPPKVAPLSQRTVCETQNHLIKITPADMPRAISQMILDQEDN